MKKHNYKVGDKVKVIGKSRPIHYFEIGSVATVTGLEGYGDYGDIELSGKTEWAEDAKQALCLDDIEPISPTHTLTPGQTYTSANGEGWECLAVRGNTAWMARKYDGGGAYGTGWQFNVDGTTDQFAHNEAFRIVFEPVREETRTRLYYSTMDGGFIQAKDGCIADVILEIPIIDGKFDCAQAKVTQCD